MPRASSPSGAGGWAISRGAEPNAIRTSAASSAGMGSIRTWDAPAHSVRLPVHHQTDGPTRGNAHDPAIRVVVGMRQKDSVAALAERHLEGRLSGRLSIDADVGPRHGGD